MLKMLYIDEQNYIKLSEISLKNSVSMSFILRKELQNFYKIWLACDENEKDNLSNLFVKFINEKKQNSKNKINFSWQLTNAENKILSNLIEELNNITIIKITYSAFVNFIISERIKNYYTYYQGETKAKDLCHIYNWKKHATKVKNVRRAKNTGRNAGNTRDETRREKP